MHFAKPVAVLVLLAAVLLAQSPHGVLPRNTATSYAAHAEQGGLQIGASLLSRKETKKAFTAGVSDCCQVIEIAFYPAKNNFVKISFDDFTLREAGKDIGMKPSTAEALAAQLQPRTPATEREHKAGVETSSEIGYERGSSIDPYTGRRVSRTGTYERETVGVGFPVGGKPQTPQATTADNRRAIEAELKEKSLPETSTWEPIAGYLYFPISKKPKDGFELVYTAGEKKIILPLK
jgi:hypothetical protein